MIITAKLLFFITIIAYIVLMLFFRQYKWTNETIIFCILFNILAQMILLKNGIYFYTTTFLFIEAAEAVMAGTILRRIQKQAEFIKKKTNAFDDDPDNGNKPELKAESTTREGLRLFTTYITIRIDGQFDPTVVDVETAVENAVEQVISAAQSDAKYNGMIEGLAVTDITNCGEAI